MDEQASLDLAERVAAIARSLHIETTLIGAYALAAYSYVRGTEDIDLATTIELPELQDLKWALDEQGLRTELRWPDAEDSLGGRVVVWDRTDEDGVPVEPVDVVNFLDSHRVRTTPAREAIQSSIELEGKPTLRYPQLKYLVALKLYAGGRGDLADVVAVLVKNPEADVEEIRSTCKRFGLDAIDELIEEAAEITRRSR
jgi:hypothetical protein